MMNYNGFQNPYQQQLNNYSNMLQQQQTQQTTYYKAIPVTNKLEANSVIPDPTGIPILFLNKGAEEIYLKQVDTKTGVAVFKEYVLKPVEEKQTEPKKEKNYDKDFKALSDKLDEIKTVLEKGVKNAK